MDERLALGEDGTRQGKICRVANGRLFFGNMPFQVEPPSMTSVVGKFSSQPSRVAAELAEAETQPYAQRVLFVMTIRQFTGCQCCLTVTPA